MKLRFYARGDLLARTHHPAMGGQPARYVGRMYLPPVQGGGAIQPRGASYPATEAAYEVEDGAPGADKAKAHCREGSLWAADEDTARACGVAFVPVKFSAGEWAKDSKPAKAAEVKS